MVKVYYLDSNGYITGVANYPDYTAGTFNNETSTDIPIPEEIVKPKFDKDKKVWVETDPEMTNAYSIIESIYTDVLEQIGEEGGSFKVIIKDKEFYVDVNADIHKFISYATSIITIYRDSLPHSIKYPDSNDNFIEIDNIEDLIKLTAYFSELFYKFNEVRISLAQKYKNEEGLTLLDELGNDKFAETVKNFILEEFKNITPYEDILNIN